MPDKRCLLDAGMPDVQADAVAAYMEDGNGKKASAVLRAWRMELLDRLHSCQKQIDCLDHFLQTYKGELS